MNAITTLAAVAAVSPEPPAAETLDLYKLAAEYETYSLDALYHEIAKLKEDVPENRIEAAAVPIRMGLICMAIRKLASKGAVRQTIEQSGIPYYTANPRMRLAKALMKASPSTVQTFLSLGAARLVEVSRLSKTYIEALATKGEYEGVSLDDLRTMGERDLRATCKFSARPDMVTPIRLGERVQSLYAGRLGEVVRVYKDGSACVCWDDGEPQEAGLGHERMPRELLVKVDGAEAAPAHAPEVEQIEVNAPAPPPADPPPPAEAHPGRPVAQPAARPSMAEREEYCEALFSLLFRHADDAGIDMLCDEFESMLDAMSNKRPRSAVAQAWAELFARFYVEGGV